MYRFVYGPVCIVCSIEFVISLCFAVVPVFVWNMIDVLLFVKKNERNHVLSSRVCVSFKCSLHIFCLCVYVGWVLVVGVVIGLVSMGCYMFKR